MNPSIACATTLIDELIRHGVTDAVLAPGSRSAPLAYALQDADRAGLLRLHVRVDERSAAFLALGLAKASRVPVPVVVTSGTAVANLHPAVLEASHAQVPMMILSADRPPELRGTGANQSTDQVDIFGSATRWSHDLGTPLERDERDVQNAVWRSVASQAVGHARGLLGGAPGPVHLNLPFREPLVPQLSEPGQRAPRLVANGGRPGGRPWTRLAAPAPTAASTIRAVPRTLAVLGDVPDPAAAAQFAALADSAGWPLIAEPFGAFHRVRVLPHGPLLLHAQDWVDAHLPERVLVGGRPTLDRGVARLLRNPSVQVELVSPSGLWSDPAHSLSAVHDWAALESSHDAVASSVDREWAAQWRAAGATLAQVAGTVIDESWPSGFTIARAVVHAVPAGSGLFVGSSSAARYLDLGRNSSLVSRDVVSVANRGLAGIDGSISTAVGFALSRADHPAYALMGDLTFVNDANGLLIGPGEPRPDLTIVVLGDDGGGIFGTLEPGAGDRAGLDPAYERVFGTPTGVSIAGLCAAYGVPHELVADARVLSERVGSKAKGIRVIEVHLDRSRQRAFQERLFALAGEALT